MYHILLNRPLHLKVTLAISVVAITHISFQATADSHINHSNPAVSTVDSFEQIFGVNKGKRRNHTKGYCFEGTLTPHDSNISHYSNSSLFEGVSNVIGRLSHKGGNNNAADDKPAEYGMGLAITSATGDVQLMSMNTLDFFPVATPEDFAELMRAKTQGSQAVKAFKTKNKDLQRFKAHEAKKEKVLTPYEGSTYRSINSFYLVDNNDKKTAVRWSFIPSTPQGIKIQTTPDFFFKNMQYNLNKGSVSWDMVITLANPEDVVDNAALPWEGEHQQITAAKLNITSVSTEDNGRCDTINYDPLVLAKGFSPSNDPLLQARRESYAISFGKRLSEKQP